MKLENVILRESLIYLKLQVYDKFVMLYNPLGFKTN